MRGKHLLCHKRYAASPTQIGAHRFGASTIRNALLWCNTAVRRRSPGGSMARQGLRRCADRGRPTRSRIRADSRGAGRPRPRPGSAKIVQQRLLRLGHVGARGRRHTSRSSSSRRRQFGGAHVPAARSSSGIDMHQHVEHVRMGLEHPRPRRSAMRCPSDTLIRASTCTCASTSAWCAMRRVRSSCRSMHPGRLLQRGPDGARPPPHPARCRSVPGARPRPNLQPMRTIMKPTMRRRQQVEKAIAEQAAADADRDHQRRRRIGARMPGVGHQHGRAQAFRDRGAGSGTGLPWPPAWPPPPTAPTTSHGGQLLDVLQAHAGGYPQMNRADPSQQSAEHQRRRGLDAAVAVGVVGIGRMAALCRLA